MSRAAFDAVVEKGFVPQINNFRGPRGDSGALVSEKIDMSAALTSDSVAPLAVLDIEGDRCRFGMSAMKNMF